MSLIRVLTVGYQGFGNVGDEAILSGLECIFPDDRAKVSWVACSDVAPVPAFREAKRVALPGLVPRVSFLRALAASDVMLIAGGSLINDYWATLIPRYLLWSILARLLGARVVWWGVGIGPIRRRRFARLAALMLKLASCVTTRDQASAALAAKLAPGKLLAVVPDAAYFLPAPSAAPDGPRAGLGIVVRSPPPGDEAALDRFAAAVSELAREGSARRLTLLAMQPALDGHAIDAIRAAIAADGHPAPDVESMPGDPVAALKKLASFDAVISIRLHALILAAVAETPCVPIVYDPKVAAAAAELDLSDVGIPLSEVSGRQLGASLAMVVEQAHRSATKSAVEGLRGRQHETALTLRSAIGAPRERAY
jgi:polysaccharide pyruvyl transferase CsaB